MNDADRNSVSQSNRCLSAQTGLKKSLKSVKKLLSHLLHYQLVLCCEGKILGLLLRFADWSSYLRNRRGRDQWSSCVQQNNASRQRLSFLKKCILCYLCPMLSL